MVTNFGHSLSLTIPGNLFLRFCNPIHDHFTRSFSQHDATLTSLNFNPSDLGGLTTASTHSSSFFLFLLLCPAKHTVAHHKALVCRCFAVPKAGLCRNCQLLPKLHCIRSNRNRGTKGTLSGRMIGTSLCSIHVPVLVAGMTCCEVSMIELHDWQWLAVK